MVGKLKDKKITLLGGDYREFYLAEYLKMKGLNVVVYGFDNISADFKESNFKEFSQNELFYDLQESDAVILPVHGVNNDGFVKAPYCKEEIKFDEKICSAINSGIPVFTGIEKQSLKDIKKNYSWFVVPVISMDEVAIYNSIPTAEGAIEIAMRELPITIHGSKSIVLGFGRVSITLVKRLLALQSEVTVAARNSVQLARAEEIGCSTVELSDLINHISKYDIIFNTIPDTVIDKNELDKISTETVIIDLASLPGGINFSYAEELNIKAIFAPGLPGKVAPKTAGEILGKVYPQLLSYYV